MKLSKNQSKIAIVVVGPTAIGKTSLAINLAKEFNAEIVSADSRQFFRELNIGTSKPNKIQLQSVRHHFINSHSIQDFYSAGMYEKDALQKLEDIFRSNQHAIVVGGSGMYVNALCYGFNEIPEVPDSVRQKLNKLLAEQGLDHLTTKLKECDPEYYESVDLKNSQRVIRALEVIEFTGERFSSFLNKNQVAQRSFKMIKIGLETEREELYAKINRRMDNMIDEGLFEEVERLYPFRKLYALQTVGYSEIFEYLEGKYDKEGTIRLLKRNSRRYAKRQLTWFKKDHSIKWFGPEDWSIIKQYVNSECSL